MNRSERPLRILQVSTLETGGGAEASARKLFDAYRRRGHASWLAVGTKTSDDPDVFKIPNEAARSRWARKLNAAADRVHSLGGLLRSIAEPTRLWHRSRGWEDFDYPGTYDLLDLPPAEPDIVHCHNLHGDYFDLGALPAISRRVPTIVNLRDAWMLAGHCAHSFDCDRWRHGCGQCPDLTIPPVIRRDATAFNFERKRAIYAQSRLYVTTPSQWLMDKVRESMLAPAAVETRVIPNGVDLTVFRPGDRIAERAHLDIQPDASVVLFTANTIRYNRWKDYATLREAVSYVARENEGSKLIFLALGERAPTEHIGRAEIRFVPKQSDPKTVAAYYRAADLYIHAAHADTFPNTVIEALACGTPVVATAVGGIPEQIRSLRSQGSLPVMNGPQPAGRDEATGVLVPPGDAHAMGAGIERLLSDVALRECLGDNAARDARERFDLQRAVDTFLDWYRQILGVDRPEVHGRNTQPGSGTMRYETVVA